MALKIVLLLICIWSGSSKLENNRLLNHRPYYPLEYQLAIFAENSRKVQVSARMKLNLPYLKMNNVSIPRSIQKGWAEFVNIKSIHNHEGQELLFSWEPKEKRWRIETTDKSEIIVEYEVTLHHDTYNWNTVGGIDGRPQQFSNNSLFWISNGLFIYPQGIQEQSQSLINFEVPDKWKTSTPWIKLKEYSFQANSLAELVHNTLMIGLHDENQISLDNMSITLAVAPEFRQNADLIKKTLAKVLPTYKNIFGELPKANYLICASQHFYEDGEAFNNSFHQMFVERDLENRKIVWANVLAHEMFHYWNGTYFLVGENVQENNWFSEGFTEYYANLALIRAGIVSEEEYLDKLAYQFARFYSSQAFVNQKVDLVKAGYEKGKNWHLIYGGGASIAFILDVEIRHRSNNTRSLDDFMRIMYQRYGKSHTKIGLVQQIEVLDQLVEFDFPAFFNKYVSGTEFNLIPILQACQKAGLSVAQYQGEFYLSSKKGETLFASLIHTASKKK